MRPGGRICALLLSLFLLLAAETRAFHLTPRGHVSSSCAAAVAAAAGGNVCSLLGSFEGGHSFSNPSPARLRCSSRLLMKAMRLPGLRTPAAPKAGRKVAAVVAWIIPPFLRHLPLLNGGGDARLRAPRVSIRGSAKAAANKRRLAAAPASMSDASPVAAAYYQDGSGVGGSSPAGAAEGGAEAQGPSSPEAADTVPIVIKYTGGVGFKSVFVGCVRVLKDQFGSSIAIRKTIVAPMEQRGSNKQRAGLFEIIVGDETFASKRGEGVYLPMADIAAAIDRLAQRREKERRAASVVAVAAAQAAAEEAAAAAAAAIQGQED